MKTKQNDGINGSLVQGCTVEAPESELNKQSMQAIKWSALGTVVRYALQLAAQIVLARILGPANYGLFVLGLLVIGFSTFFADFGFGWALVQAQDLKAEDIRLAVTWQLIAGVLVAGSLWVIAPLIATYFDQPKLQPIIRWLSLSCIFSAAASPALNLLTRNLDFRALNIIQVISYAIGYLAVGIPMAYWGNGVWALVAAWNVQTLCTLILATIKNPYPLKPLLWCRGANSISQVGATVFFTNLCNWFLNNLDRILIGRLLDPHGVGLYVVGYNLANTPNALLVGALQPAFLAAGARIQEQRERLRKAYLSVIAVIWIIIAPLFVVLSVLAPDLVGMLYGPAWSTSGVVLSIFAVGMPAYITWALSTPILWNTGRSHYESLLQLPIVLFSAFALFYITKQGVVAVSLVAVLVLYLRSIFISIAACRRLDIGIKDLRGSAIRGLLAIAVTAASTIAGVWVAAIITPSHILTLVAGGMSGAGALLCAVLLCPMLATTGVSEMLDRFYSAFPNALGMIWPSARKGKKAS